MSRLTGSRLAGAVAVVGVVVLSMAFAAANAGHRVTITLGLFTLYRAPVTLVAFSGLLLGMLVMFAAGIYSDLKVRRILRERLAEETREAKGWIDRNQRDLFAQDPDPEPQPSPSAGQEVESDTDARPPEGEVPKPPLAPLPLPPLEAGKPEEEEPQSE
jgi:uncharacterized integral membrane protein